MASISAILSSVIGSCSVLGKALQLHPSRQIRWPPQSRGGHAPDPLTVAPALRFPPISTTSMDANEVSGDVSRPASPFITHETASDAGMAVAISRGRVIGVWIYIGLKFFSAPRR